MTVDVTSQVSVSAISDGQAGDAADVLTAVNNLITVINNVLNGAQEAEGLLMTELAAVPATPATGKQKLYVTTSGLYLIDDNGNSTLLLGILADDTQFILSSQIFS